jgi:hypothetical protein
MEEDTSLTQDHYMIINLSVRIIAYNTLPNIGSLLAQLVERYTSIKLEAQLRYVAVSRSTRLAGKHLFLFF